MRMHVVEEQSNHQIVPTYGGFWITIVVFERRQPPTQAIAIQYEAVVGEDCWRVQLSQILYVAIRH